MCSSGTREKIKQAIRRKNSDLTNEQIDEIVTAQYSIANIIFDLWLENKEKVI
jgi:hypothetical protein